MNYIISKILILLTCVLLAVFTGESSNNDIIPIDTAFITAMLLSVIISGLLPVVLDKKEPGINRTAVNIILSTFSLTGLVNGSFIIFLPEIVYEMFYYKLYPSLFIAGAALLATSFQSPFKILLIAVLCGISVFIAFLNRKVNSLQNTLFQMQDIAKEKELLIHENTKQIIDNQNANIYNATLQERNRIARDIHDNVGHMLTRSILQVGSIKVINKDNTLTAPLDALHETLNTAMTSMRNSVHDLYDESVDMKSSIEKIADDINACNGEDSLSCSLYYDCGSVVPKNIKYAFIAIVKEAVNNTSRHSNASEIKISIDEHPGFYKLCISDNGTTFNGNIDNLIKNESSGIGIKNITDRVQSIGGTVKFDTTKGFRIIITVMKQD